jgi:hypothetical protein
MRPIGITARFTFEKINKNWRPNASCQLQCERSFVAVAAFAEAV